MCPPLPLWSLFWILSWLLAPPMFLYHVTCSRVTSQGWNSTMHVWRSQKLGKTLPLLFWFFAQKLLEWPLGMRDSSKQPVLSTQSLGMFGPSRTVTILPPWYRSTLQLSPTKLADKTLEPWTLLSTLFISQETQRGGHKKSSEKGCKWGVGGTGRDWRQNNKKGVTLEMRK
jgi:hypothetical protein